MRANCILTLGSGLLLAQCASKTSEIKPPYISPVSYQSYTCPQLAHEAEALSAKEAELSGGQQQRWVASVPFLGGDAKAAATRLTLIKGQLNAIEEVRKQKQCR